MAMNYKKLLKTISNLKKLEKIAHLVSIREKTKLNSHLILWDMLGILINPEKTILLIFLSHLR
jgi:hypothetical protein